MAKKWFYYPEEQRKYIEFLVEEDRIIVSPLGNEMSVNFTFCGKDYYVIIPTEYWDRENSTIPANLVGEADDQAIVSFPATMLQMHTLGMPKADVEPIAVPLPGICLIPILNSSTAGDDRL